MDKRKKALWRALLFTILIFTVGILLNHIFDSFRISIIEDVITVNEIENEAYRAEQFFIDTFGGEKCEVMTARIAKLKQEVRKVGEDLGSYSRFSLFRKNDYDYLKRKYFLLELRFFSIIKKINKECDDPYLPILFFYKIDQDNSEIQGFILQSLSDNYEQEVVVLSIDKEYPDEPLISLLVETYNITATPSLVIDGKTLKGLVSENKLKQTIMHYLKRADPYASVDFMYTLKAAGTNISLLLEQLRATADDEKADSFARGDAKLVIGRLTDNETMICESLSDYDKINSTNAEEMAIVYETSAAIGCERNRKTFLKTAAKEWRTAGNNYRAELLERMAAGKQPVLKFEEQTNISMIPVLQATNATVVIIGKTEIIINQNDTVVSQDDRVYRDWLGGQIANPYGPELLTTFSERLKYNKTELMPEIGWHEGARIKEISAINITHIPAVGTLAARKEEKWYGVDDKGVFRFEIPLDKISYPTTRFLRRDIAVLIDTHGVNMLVEQAMRYNASVIISDCDHPGKVYAAKYLSENNISVVCYPDKYVYLAIGHNLRLVGSPPARIQDTKVIIGGRPIQITKKDRILAVNATNEVYALWYYQTPTLYFETIAREIELNVSYYTLADFDQMKMVVQKAREINATVLATRVFNKNDYEEVKNWLDEDLGRRVILFHSASYPYGQKLLREYKRAGFDDPNPVFQ